MRLWTSGITAVAVAAVLPSGIAAQETIPSAWDLALTAVAQATELREAGRWEDAESLLMEQNLSCGSEGARACVLLMDYSLGYLYSLRGDAEPEHYRIYLQLAAERFASVIEQDPSHIPTLNSLALVNRKLGPAAFTDRFLDLARELDPSSAGWYLLLHGDTHRDAGDWSTAVQSYWRAADATPDDETVRLRIATSYQHLPTERLSELQEVLGSWVTRFPEASVAGYETIIQRASSLPPEMGIAALAGWTGIQADRDRISVEAVRGLRSEGLEEAIEALASFVADPAGFSPYGTWWSQNRLLEPLARVALSVGRRAARAGLAEEAARALQAGSEIAPIGMSREMVVVSLALAGELASLYHRYPEVDAFGAYAYLIDDMFTGKGAAIASSDYRAMELFHTTLGLIYVERGEWEGLASPFQSANYQLRAAVEAIRQQTERDGVYRPVPELQALRAQGVLETGGGGEAAELYLEAAAGFLDTDQFDRAMEAIGRIRELGGGGGDLPSLVSFARSRLELKRAVEAGEQGSHIELCAPSSTDEQVGAGVSALPTLSGLLERQSFKVHADCASFWTGPGGTMHAVRALSLLGDGSGSLAGVSDVVRVERLSRDLQQGVGLLPQPTHLDPDGSDHQGVMVPIQLAPQQEPQYLILPATTIAVRDLLEGVDLTDPRFQIRLDGADAVLLRGATELDRVGVGAALARIRARPIRIR